MKAAVFHEVGDMRLDEVSEPEVQTSTIEAFKALVSRNSSWLKVEPRPGKQASGNGREERVPGHAALDRAIAEADPFGESRSKTPGSL